MRIGRMGFVVGLGVLTIAGFAINAIATLKPFGLPPEIAAQALGVGVLAAACFLVTWRCHDFNKSFWHAFWTDQVPVIGPLWALYELFVTPGTDGMNSYGHKPFL
jgi:uncharacterized membrane protein YhaH (DUF805 family)